MTPVEFQPLAQRLINTSGWDNKMRELVLASKQLPTLASERRTNDNLVKGCDSDVWLDWEYSGAQLKFVAYSPSKVIRGILAIILEQTNHLPPDKLIVFDFDNFSEKLALSRFLSQSRGNGLRQVIQQIRTLAATQG